MAQLTAVEALSKLNQYTSVEELAYLTSQITGKVIDAAADAEHFLYAYNLNVDGSGANAFDVVKQAIDNGKASSLDEAQRNPGSGE